MSNVFSLNPLRLILVLAFAVCLVATPTLAQRRTDDSSHYRPTPVPAHLMPIERALGSAAFGGIYFYGGKRLSSPYSLEIPFYELNDPEVSHRFSTFKTMTSISRLTAIVPLAFILLNRNSNPGAYWTVYGGSIAASLTLGILGNVQVNRAVTRYNDMLRQTRLGVSTATVPLTGQLATGVGVAYSF